MKMNFQVMQTNQQIVEVTGSPAQVWGNIFIPARGAQAEYVC